VQEKPVEKPPEKKPEPQKPEIEKTPTKASEAKEEPKIDPMAQLIAKNPAKPKEAKAKAAQPPAPPQQQLKKKEMSFAQLAEAALINKQDPTRQEATGAALNQTPSSAPTAGRDNSATWGAMFKAQVERCWNKPSAGLDARRTEVVFSIKLKRDGALEAMPVAIGSASTPYLRVLQDSGLRAIVACQPYKLPVAFFEEWKFFEPAFCSGDLDECRRG
jgi:colicin import membrane protein